MLIHEIGVIIGGIPIVSRNYQNVEKDSRELICRSAFMSSLLDFTETLLSPMEYFESDHYNVVFDKNKINVKNFKEIDFFAYFISDKTKHFEKIVKKKIIPLLEKIIYEFKTRYNGKDFTNISNYIDFCDIIDKITGEFNSVDEKFSSIF